MTWGFRTVWKHLRSGSLLLSHDIGGNEAFIEFMQEKAIPWSSYRVLHLLGGFIRVHVDMAGQLS